MPNLNELRGALDNYLINNWTITPIVWDNIPNRQTDEVPWIRPTLIIDYSENITVNTRRTRHYGAYTIQSFTPLNEGAGKNYENVVALIDLFQNKTLDPNLLMLAGSMRRIGDEGNGWYQINIILPFQADQEET